MSEYDGLELNPAATPFAVYADCPPSAGFSPGNGDACLYCDDGAEFGSGHTHWIYETREGASLHTADELADIFLDAVEFYAAPWRRPDYCPRDVSGWVRDDEIGDTMSGADALQECIALGESALGAVGLYVTWDDGYVIERVSELEDDAELEEVPAPAVTTCRYCSVPITFEHGFWRDGDDDNSDGFGGDASCPAREIVNGRAQPHAPAPTDT